jgi:peptidoglycan/LPS O-acetylase OafA/YrhL
MEKEIKPENRARVLYLDGFRGIACLMVFFFHYATNLGIPVGRHMFGIWGFTGVHLFFILSGYLLFQPFLKAILGSRPFPSIGSFYLRRFVRIYPPFFLSLLIYVGLRLKTHTHIPSPANILAHAGLVSNYLNPKLWYSINPVFWSLAIEMQFYVLLPILSRLFYQRNAGRPNLRAAGLILTFFLIGGVARSIEFFHWRSTEGIHSYIFFRSIFSYLDLFAVGMFIALLRAEPFATRIRTRTGFGVLALAGFAIMIPANLWCTFTAPASWLESPRALYTILFPVAICTAWGMVLLANVLYEKKSPRFLNRGFLVWAGQISYSIYLYHVGVEFFMLRVVHLSNSLGWDLRNLIYAVITLPVTLAVSALMYQLVERPCVQWLTRPTNSRLASTDVAASLTTPPVLGVPAD